MSFFTPMQTATTNRKRTPEEKQQQREEKRLYRREQRGRDLDILREAAGQCDCEVRFDSSRPEGYWPQGVYVKPDDPAAIRDLNTVSTDTSAAYALAFLRECARQREVKAKRLGIPVEQYNAYLKKQDEAEQRAAGRS